MARIVSLFKLKQIQLETDKGELVHVRPWVALVLVVAVIAIVTYTITGVGHAVIATLTFLLAILVKRMSGIIIKAGPTQHIKQLLKDEEFRERWDIDD
jgi:hypothetical protein